MAMYFDQTVQALAATWAIFTFDYPLEEIDLQNKSGATIVEYSFDGTNKAGEVEHGEGTVIKMGGSKIIYLQGTVGQPYKMNSVQKVGM